jgi:hypothetical protein
MSNPTYENSMTYSSSCTVDEAVMYLLGFPQSSIQAKWAQHSDDPSDGEWISSDGFDYLTDSLEFAKSELIEARYDKCTAEVIDEKLAELNRRLALNKRAHEYKSAIIDELSKSESNLRTDKLATTNLRDPFITLLSLKSWANDVLKISILEDIEMLPSAFSTPKLQKKTSSKCPRYEVNDDDTPAPQGELWYIDARYLARQFIAQNPELQITKEKLAKKVAELMKAENIVHSANKPYGATTVRKAFRGIKF